MRHTQTAEKELLQLLPYLDYTTLRTPFTFIWAVSTQPAMFAALFRGESFITTPQLFWTESSELPRDRRTTIVVMEYVYMYLRYLRY